jgi:H/ACA ribonucleoprotein complex subunit 4
VNRMTNPQNNLIELFSDETDETYGCRPEQRPINQLLEYGIIPLDKPEGPTSHEVVAWIRKMLHVKKAGHSGTLDPSVTGLLPIGVGEATKVLSVLLLGPKEYQAVARLHDPVDDKKLLRVLEEFTGEIFQRPPQRSSVKRTTRTRTIYNLDLLERNGRLLLLRVLCQAGTYVRKLVYDIGEVLGPGATMVELRRTSVCHIRENDGLVRLHDLAYAVESLKSGDEAAIRRCIKPVEFAVSWLKSVYVRDSAVDAICHGAQLAVPGIVKLSKEITKGNLVSFYTLKGELIAVGEAQMTGEEITQSEKGIAFSTKRVIMKPGTYERLWRTRREDNPTKENHDPTNQS